MRELYVTSAQESQISGAAVRLLALHAGGLGSTPQSDDGWMDG